MKTQINNYFGKLTDKDIKIGMIWCKTDEKDNEVSYYVLTKIYKEKNMLEWEKLDL